MAYFNTEEDEKQKQEQSSATGEKVISGSDGAQVQTNPQGNSAPSIQTKKGSGFTNLIQYVNANQGNDATMGGAIKDNVNQNIINNNSQASSFNTKAKAQVDSNTIKDNNVINALKSNPLNVKKEDFQQQYNASYNGPNSASEVENYNDLSNAYNNLQQKANLSDDYEGRKELLKDVYNRPTYSQGEQRLDSFILGAGQGGVNALNKVKEEVNNSKQGWSSLLESINNNIRSARDITDKTKADTRGAYSMAVKGSEDSFNALSQQLAKEKATNALDYSNLKNKLGKGNSDAYSELGLDNNTGEFLKNSGFNLSKLISQGQERGLGDVVSSEDIAKYNALMSLQDSPGKYDFSSLGGNGNYLKTNDALINAGKEAASLNSTLQQRLAAEQEARDEEYNIIKAALSGQLMDNSAALEQLGLKKSDLAKAKGGRIGNYDYQELNPLQYLKKGDRLDTASVASDLETSQWNSLMNTLGINKKLAKSQNSANYSFDKDRFLNDLEALKKQVTTHKNYTRDGNPIDDNIRQDYDFSSLPKSLASTAGDIGTNSYNIVTGKKKLF